MPSGIIIKGIGGFYYVASEMGIFECKARGVFRKNELTPLPGDRVRFSVVDPEKRMGSLDEILPRDSELVRPAVSNVDQVVLVIAIKTPEPDFLLLDKLLVTARDRHIAPVICINKVDLDPGEMRGRITDSYAGSGFPIVFTSSKTRDGLEELARFLQGRVSVFAGQSGVGKSTLLNLLMETTVMETGEVSERTERGRHTTRHAELVSLQDGGYLVDTPGFSSFELAGIPHDELQYFYPEFEGLMEKCRFKGCSHINEPDCRIKEAVEAGAIDRGRYERYKELFACLKLNEDFKYKKQPRKGT